MERFLWICLAGAAGTGTRYLIALWAAQRFGSSFPFGTLIVNLVGCFAIAAVMHASFNYETMRLMEEGATGAAAFNAIATIVGAFAAGWFGMVCARQLIGR